MQKWIAIRASAVLALAGSAATLVFSVGMAAAVLFVSPRSAQPAPPAVVRGFGLVMSAVMALASIWGILTAIGVFRRRNWARISMMVVGGLLAFFGGTGALALLLVPFPVPANTAVNPHVMSAIHEAIVAFYALVAAVGAWWAILFNRASAKQYCAQHGPIAESARPLSIGVIGWYFVVSAAGTALCGVFRIPTMLFSVVVAGWATLAVCTALTAAQLYLGAGLLQLNEKARVWTIAYLLALGASGIVTAVAPGAPARMLTLMADIRAHFHMDAYPQMDMPATPAVWIALTSIVYVAVLLWFLVRRRAAFAPHSQTQG